MNSMRYDGHNNVAARLIAFPRSFLFLAAVLLAVAACSNGGSGGSSGNGPVANPDSYSVNTNGSVTGNVLANDVPNTGLTAELVAAPTHAASFALNTSGSFTYLHDGSAVTADTFTYRAKDGSTVSNTATVTININQPPVATNGCYAIFDDSPPMVTSLSVHLSASDSNGSGTIASYVIDTLPANGTISGCAAAGCSLSNGTVTYVPKNNLTGRRGMDKFTFHVVDAGALTSSAATAWILNNGMVRIMPLGDSITQGVYTAGNCGDGNCPAIIDRIGYRLKLFSDLTNLNVSPHFPVQLVGGLLAGSGQGLAPPNDQHEGHPGDCIGPTPGGATGWCQMDDIDNPGMGMQRNLSTNIINWLNSNPADIILLHAGTNDLTTSATAGSGDANTLLNNISTWAQSNYPVTVFMARIVPATDGSINVDDFNNKLASIATSRTGVTVPPMVNQQAQFWVGSGTVIDRNTAQSSLMASVYHPNQTGYDKMADKWNADLIASGVLPNCP